MTSAVIQAIRERLEAVCRCRKRAATLAAIQAISERSAAILQGPPLDNAELLYDEHGLPK